MRLSSTLFNCISKTSSDGDSTTTSERFFQRMIIPNINNLCYNKSSPSATHTCFLLLLSMQTPQGDSHNSILECVSAAPVVDVSSTHSLGAFRHWGNQDILKYKKGRGPVVAPSRDDLKGRDVGGGN